MKRGITVTMSDVSRESNSYCFRGSVAADSTYLQFAGTSPSFIGVIPLLFDKVDPFLARLGAKNLVIIHKIKIRLFLLAVLLIGRI